MGVTLPTNGILEEARLSLPSPAEGQGAAESARNLIAYLVSNAAKPLEAELRRFLNEKLPDYMVPSRFIFLDALPLSPNGKIDRLKLPSLEESPRDLTSVPIPPRSELEELIANIWRDVLQIENLSVHDNFFALGGHSLLAIQVVSRLQEAFNKEVPLRVLFDAPTIADLTSRCADLLTDGQALRLPSIVPVPRDGPLPLSMNQEHIWQMEQMIPGTRFFNMPYVYHLSGDLNVEAFEKALNEFVRRHEALRTVFREIDGQPVQIIKDVAAIHLTSLDLQNESANEASQQAAAEILADRTAGFNLTDGPLFRTKLLRLTDNDALFLMTMHHIIGDQWSMNILHDELTILYQAFFQNKESPLPRPAVQFADYAFWERRLLQNGLLNTKLDYWRAQLATPTPNINFGKRNTGKPLNFRVCSQPIRLEEATVSNLKRIALRLDATPNIVMIAVLNTLLVSHTGQNDIRIAMLMANRGRREVNNTIGHFANTVILRTYASAERTFTQLVEHVREKALLACANVEVPFEYLARALATAKRAAGSSISQILLDYQYSTSPVSTVSNLSISSFGLQHLGIENEVKPTRFDLIFTFMESLTVLTGTVTYKPSTVKATLVSSMVAGIPRIINDVLVGIDPLSSVRGRGTLPRERCSYGD